MNNRKKTHHQKKQHNQKDDNSKTQSSGLTIPQKEVKEIVVREIRKFSGPYPPPDILKQYEDIQGGFSDRILSMAEKQNDHRIAMEAKIISSRINNSKRGQYFAFIIMIAFLIAACFSVYNGDSMSAIFMTGFDAVAGVLVYFLGKKHEKEELATKKVKEDPANKDTQ